MPPSFEGFIVLVVSSYKGTRTRVRSIFPELKSLEQIHSSSLRGRTGQVSYLSVPASGSVLASPMGVYINVNLQPLSHQLIISIQSSLQDLNHSPILDVTPLHLDAAPILP